MTQSEDDRDRDLFEKWHQAERNAKQGDCAELARLLRHFALHPDEQTHEFPNLWFVADLLDGKFKKAVGRKPDSRLLKGVKEMRSAAVVDYLITSQQLSLEEAVVQAASILLMSESAIKKHYLECKRHGLLEPEDDSALEED